MFIVLSNAVKAESGADVSAAHDSQLGPSNTSGLARGLLDQACASAGFGKTLLCAGRVSDIIHCNRIGGPRTRTCFYLALRWGNAPTSVLVFQGWRVSLGCTARVAQAEGK